MYTKTICIYGMHLPASSKGCCLNPKGWCIGTPYGRSRYVYIYIYHISIYLYTHIFIRRCCKGLIFEPAAVHVRFV